MCAGEDRRERAVPSPWSATAGHSGERKENNMNIITTTTKSNSSNGWLPRRGRRPGLDDAGRDDCEGHMPRIRGGGFDDGCGDDTEAHMPRVRSGLDDAGNDACEGHMPRIRGGGFDDGCGDDTEAHMPRLGGGRFAVAAAGSTLALAAFATFGSVSHAAGEEWWYDDTGDGVYDTVRVDRWGDGVADVEAYDWNQNSVLELIRIDTNNDGLIDLFGVDTFENGRLDRVDLDYNQDGWTDHSIYDVDEDGIDDAVEAAQSMTTGTPGVAIISSPTNPDGFYNLMMTMAAVTGQATFGTSDSDHDGYHDNIDYYPSDPYRY
jgi:hypothetical protein